MFYCKQFEIVCKNFLVNHGVHYNCMNLKFAIFDAITNAMFNKTGLKCSKNFDIETKLN